MSGRAWAAYLLPQCACVYPPSAYSKTKEQQLGAAGGWVQHVLAELESELGVSPSKHEIRSYLVQVARPCYW